MKKAFTSFVFLLIFTPIAFMQNVGIGLTDATNTLDIQSGSARSGDHAMNRPLYITGDIGGEANGIEFRHSNGTQGLGFGYNTIYAVGSAPNQILGFKAKGPEGYLIFYTFGSERMRISPLGYVGIGVAAPSARLEIQKGNDVEGTLTLRGSVYHSYFHTGLAEDTYIRGGKPGAQVYINDVGTLGNVHIGTNLGIGTTSPVTRLQVTGGMDANNSSTSGYFVLGETSGENIVIDNNEILARTNSVSSTLHLQASGGDMALCQHASGKVGIGNSLPASKLHVTGGVEAALNMAGYFQLGSTNSANLVFDNNEILARNNGVTADLGLQVDAGRVGIGTNTPASKLHVTGGGEADLNSQGYMVLGLTTGLNMVMDVNEILARSNGQPTTLNLQVHGGDLSLCSGSGKVGIGSTTAPAAKLHVREGDNIWQDWSSPGYLLLGDLDDYSLAFDRSSIMARFNGGPTHLYLQHLGGDLFLCQGNGRVAVGPGFVSLDKFTVDGNGRFSGSVMATAFITSSDIRYKTNIKPIENALANIQAIHGITYDWDRENFPEKQFNDHRQIGVSAQDLEKVYPEMVFTDDAGYKTVDYSRLTPVLIEAVKELSADAQEMKAKTDQIEQMQAEAQEMKAILMQLQQEIQQLKQQQD